MTVFRDIKNNEYVADTEIKLTEGVNGEKSLTGTIYFGNDVKKNLAKGWTMVFNDEEYAIVTFRYNDTDNTVSFSAVQMFFYTLSVKAFHEKWNGSHPLNKYLNAIFKNTGYSYINETSVSAFEKENWGLKDKLTLFNDIINQISAEFEVKGTTVYIKDKIGSDLSTVVRQGFNLSKAEIETDSSSFATYGVGYGAHDDADDQTSPRLSVEYYSPLYDMYKDKFGAIEAEPVDDERYTVSDNLLAAVKKKVDNSWSLSITVSLIDLQNAGYPYAMASAGDSITIVDESLNFEDEVRIIKVVSSYNINGERISVDVTCGDLTMAQTQSASSSVATSTITDIINGNSVLPDAWFSEQMQLATNSILAARTELKFTDQGIIAIDTTDHNKMVILNSAGIGVSTDGGQKFKTAITAESIDGQNINIKNINASNITTGTISGANLNINLNTGEILFQKGAIKSTNGKLNISVDDGTMNVTNNNGDGVYFKDGQLVLSDQVWENSGTTDPKYGKLFFGNVNGSFWQSGTILQGQRALNLRTEDSSYIGGPNWVTPSGAGISLMDEGLAASNNHTSISLLGRYGVRIIAGKNITMPAPQSVPEIAVGCGDDGSDTPDISMMASTIKLNSFLNGKGGDLTLTSDGSARVVSMSIYNRTYSSGDHVVITGYGTLGRLTSARKYKIADTPALDVIGKAKRVLDIKPAEWYDKAEIESIADAKTNGTEAPGESKIEKHYGFIADDFDAAGLTEVVNYHNGEVDSLSYDHISMYHHVILQNHEKRIAELETEVKQLKGEI